MLKTHHPLWEIVEIYFCLFSESPLIYIYMYKIKFYYGLPRRLTKLFRYSWVILKSEYFFFHYCVPKTHHVNICFMSYIYSCFTVGRACDLRFSLPYHCSYCAHDNKALNLNLELNVMLSLSKISSFLLFIHLSSTLSPSPPCFLLLPFPQYTSLKYEFIDEFHDKWWHLAAEMRLMRGNY